MTDIQIIKQIEQQIGFKLKQLPYEKIFDEEKQRFVKEKFVRYGIKHGLRAYSLDNESNVSSLSLDFISSDIYDYSILTEFNKVESISLRGGGKFDMKILSKLKNIDLSFCSIKNFSFLKDLKSLTTLDLSYNKISDISFLKDLKSLTSLYLRYNNISDFSFLKYLKSLTSLDLMNSKISDFSFLKDLKSLTSLDLRNNKISDISFLKDLKSLTSLNLSDNYISDISFLKDLKSLTSLDLRNSKISDFSFLKDLKSLTSLDLRNNYISDISFLKDLKSLTSLDLRNNNISDFSFLKDLKSLTSLNLRNNNISDFSFLKDLKSLTSLDLSSNNISDFSFLKDLKSLTSLDLRNNNISDISFLKDLKSLTSLDLSSNNISDFSFLKDLKSLTSLDLNYNKISDISFLKDLKSLTSLDLSSNKISDFSFLKDLKSLTSLDLRNNNISELPVWITDFDMDINFEDNYFVAINLYNNPIKNIPIEIIKQGKEAIRNYFKQIKEQEAEYLFETKVLVIGEGGTGKTSFVTKMKDETKDLPEDEDTTLGIDVTKWSFDVNNHQRGKHTMYANLWDFGGQKLYQGTHQIFFCQKSFYVLLDDTREEKTDFAYWLNTVEQLAGEESKLLIVINKKLGHIPQIDEDGLRGRFGKLISDFYPVDLKNDINKIQLLQDKVKQLLQELPGIGDPLPASWVNIRKDLFKLKENYISNERYYKICNNNKTDLTKLDYISDYFNRIGVFTHYYDNRFLKHRIYLNTDWLLNMVYEVLNHKIVKDNNGRITEKDLKQIWNNSEHYDEQDSLSALMHRFGLMYEIEEIEEIKEYVVPAHLSAKQPYAKWQYEDKKEVLQFAYEFDKYMPKGIMPRIIVALHKYIQEHDMVWNKGVDIEHEGTYAEIKETYDRTNKYLIRLYGNDKKDLLGRINQEFDKILDPFKKLKFEKLVPCICSVCKGNPNSHFHKYSELIYRKEAGKRTIECAVKPFENVNVIELLDGITPKRKKYQEESDKSGYYKRRTVTEESGVFTDFRNMNPENEDKILEELISACNDSVDNAKQLGLYHEDLKPNEQGEDKRTKYIQTLLNKAFKKYTFEDQNSGGISGSGKSEGHIDIAVWEDKTKISLIEALIHKDKAYLINHFKKSVKNYNQLKHKFIFILTYCEKTDLSKEWNKYLKWIKEISNLKKIKDISDMSKNQFINIAYSEFRLDSQKITRVYHLFVDFSGQHHNI